MQKFIKLKVTYIYMNYLRTLYRKMFKVDARAFVTKQALVESLALSIAKDEETIAILFGEK